MEKPRRLPVGMQNFEEIRNDGYVYVDKTDLIWDLVHGDKNVLFFARPRRFGKTLLLNILHQYFNGRQDLFTGLKIMDKETEWKKRPVFRFDFSGALTASQLNNKIDSRLSFYEGIYGKTGYDKELGDRFLSLIQAAHKQSGEKVAILFDEYDYPIQHCLFDEKTKESISDVYRSFFPVLKTADEAGDLYFMLITGITKFTQLSLFSVLNNVTILSTSEKYSTLCGITPDELREYFQPELESISKKKKCTVDELLDKMKDLYDGYHFAGDLKDVYNPYSVLQALSTGKLTNYWVSSGATVTLQNFLLESFIDENLMLEGTVIGAEQLDMSDVSRDNLPLFLYQTGYLTIKSFNDDDAFYTLGIPNKEVRTALYDTVLPNAVGKQRPEVDSCISRMRADLSKGAVNEAFTNLQQLVSSTPYAVEKGDKEKVYESFFRFILKNAFSLCGCEVQDEQQMISGRMDIVAARRNLIMVIELKLDTNGGLKAAREQIENRNYASSFSAEKRPVYTVAVEISAAKRGITAFDVKRER